MPQSFSNDEFIRVVVVLPEFEKDYELIGDVLFVTEEYACRLADSLSRGNVI